MERSRAKRLLREKSCLVQDKYTEDIFGMTFRANDLKQKVPAPNQIKYKKIGKDRPKQLMRRGNSVLVKRVVIGEKPQPSRSTQRHRGKPQPSRSTREVMALNGIRRKDREKNKDEIVPSKTKTFAKKTPMELRTRAALRAKKRFVKKCAVKAIRKHRRKAAIACAKLRRAQARKAGRPIGKKNADKKVPDKQVAAPVPAKGAATVPDKQVAAPAQGQSAPSPASALSKSPAVSRSNSLFSS